MAIVSGDVMAWLDFDDGSGTTVSDLSGNGRDVTLTGSPSWTSDAPTDLVGSVDFNGSSHYGKFASDFLGGLSDGTIVAWVLPDGTSTGSVLTNRNSGGGANYFYINSGTNWDNKQQQDGTNVSYSTATVSQPTGSWSMITLSQSSTGGSAEAWQNNSEETLTNFGSPTAWGNSSTDIYVASRAGVSTYFDGHIAQIIILDKQLTSAEIGDLYNSGNGITYGDFFGGGGATFTPKAIMY